MRRFIGSVSRFFSVGLGVFWEGCGDLGVVCFFGFFEFFVDECLGLGVLGFGGCF